MHTEALNFIMFVKNNFNNYFINKTVLDVGSGDINGNNRFLFANCKYHGNDVIEGKNVTIVSKTKDLPFKDESIDTIISTECFQLDPEYPDSLRKIYKMLKQNGLFVFTCASIGRAEHGTLRSTPTDSFGTIGNLNDMTNYYKNLSEKNINDVLNLEKLFSVWNFYYNSKKKDLYFVGIKTSETKLYTTINEFKDSFVTNTSSHINHPPISPKLNHLSDVCLLINTCKHYFSNIPDLLLQINQSWFPNKNVIIVSAQEDDSKTYYIDDVKIVNVPYTGLHLTSFIYINENMEQYQHIRYWIALPDTIKFGSMFFDHILNYYNYRLTTDRFQSIPLVDPYFRPTMDMGIVHSNHILRMTDYLQRIKTHETNFDVLKVLKKQLIHDENTILGIISGFSERTKHNCKLLDHTQLDYISTSAEQLKERLLEGGRINEVYFTVLDLYKYQRNFISADVDLILTL